MTNTKAQIRALQSKSSPVYKTKSETSLTSGFRNLTIREKSKTPTRRGFCTGGSGRINTRSLQDIAKVFEEDKVKNVVVVAGAGISTPSGIPDFRTPGTGLYDNLQQYRIPYPEAIFDIDYFHRNPKPFFTLAKELFPSLGNYRPNYIHYFVRLLHEKGILLRMYTQNIDGLERLAGIPPAKLVEAHGTFATATCVLCGQKCDGDEIKDRIVEDKLPKCKRTSCAGMVKPDIVFFGEDLPKKFYYHLKDMLQADVILVMGTSLEVQPFAGIIDSVQWNVPRILFNRDIVGPFRYHRRSKDVVAEGDILETMQKFVDMIGWKDELKDLIIKSEGDFNIGQLTSTTSLTDTSERKKPEIKPLIKDPLVNAIWRQNAEYDLYDYSSESSSESDSSETTDSDSSELENSRPIQRLSNQRYNIKNSAKTTHKNSSTPSYSMPSKITNQTKITKTTVNKTISSKQQPVIKPKPFNRSKPTTSKPVTDREGLKPEPPCRPNSYSTKQAPANHVQKPPIPKRQTFMKRAFSNQVIRKNTLPGGRKIVDSGSLSKNRRPNITSVQVYKALRHRSGSADLPLLRLREKMSHKIEDSSSNESISGKDSGS